MMNLKEETERCLLCYNAPCTISCNKNMDPAAMIRALRFENSNVGDYIDGKVCEICSAECEKNCIHYDTPIRIKEMATKLKGIKYSAIKVDLSIDFLGVKCENPFFLSSSIVAGSYEMCAAAFEAGWAGAVYKTIGFLQPEEVSPRFSTIETNSNKIIGLQNLEQISDKPLEENLLTFKRLKEKYPSKIIVASIMGQTDEEWIKLASLCEEYKADIIECNFSCPHMSGDGLGSDVGQNPELVKHYTECVRKGTSLPILAKMTPKISHMEIPAIAAIEGGADGIAAINTIKSIVGIDLETMSPYPLINGNSSVAGYSGKAVKPIALRFIYDMISNEKLKDVSLSGIGGIETWRDALEFILLGCGNIQVTTSVMEYGYGIVNEMILGLSNYMSENGYNSIEELKGKALKNIKSTEALDRQTVVYPIINKETCIGCGRCFVSCTDAGHQAIQFDDKTRTPKVLASKCVGCHLCKLVCPTNSITNSKRVRKKQEVL